MKLDKVKLNRETIIKIIKIIKKLQQSNKIINKRINDIINKNLPIVEQDVELKNKETKLALLELLYTLSVYLNKDPIIKKKIISILELINKNNTKTLKEVDLSAIASGNISYYINYIISSIHNILIVSPFVTKILLLAGIALFLTSVWFTLLDKKQINEKEFDQYIKQEIEDIIRKVKRSISALNK